jgi:hypothetical protein
MTPRRSRCICHMRACAAMCKHTPSCVRVVSTHSAPRLPRWPRDLAVVLARSVLHAAAAATRLPSTARRPMRCGQTSRSEVRRHSVRWCARRAWRRRPARAAARAPAARSRQQQRELFSSGSGGGSSSVAEHCRGTFHGTPRCARGVCVFGGECDAQVQQHRLLTRHVWCVAQPASLSCGAHTLASGCVHARARWR